MSNATVERGAPESEKSVDELIQEFNLMKDIDKAGGGTNYQARVKELADWAMGVVDDRRTTLFPAKTDNDFQKVLDALEEDLLSGM